MKIYLPKKFFGGSKRRFFERNTKHKHDLTTYSARHVGITLTWGRIYAVSILTKYFAVLDMSSQLLRPVYSDATQLDIEWSCVGVAIDTSPTQLNSTRRRVESSWVVRYKRAFTNMSNFYGSCFFTLIGVVLSPLLLVSCIVKVSVGATPGYITIICCFYFSLPALG